MLTEAIYVAWESFRGGGGTRPRGCSLHLTEEDADSFKQDYMKGLSRDERFTCPRPAMDYIAVFITESMYQRIMFQKLANGKQGLRLEEEEENKALEDKEILFASDSS